VHNVRSLIAVASLAALFAISNPSSSNAASASHKAANASYASSNASHMSRAQEPVPANCIRQECGKLWCWNMGGGKK
jgi:hypothetical protein